MEKLNQKDLINTEFILESDDRKEENKRQSENLNNMFIYEHDENVKNSDLMSGILI